MIVISFFPIHQTKHIVIQNDNITLYYKDFDSMLKIMDFSDIIHEDTNSPFTYIFSHDSDATKKSKYHDGIPASYADEGHFHFERKDSQLLSIEDAILFIKMLANTGFLKQEEASVAANKIKSTEPEQPANHDPKLFTPVKVQSIAPHSHSTYKPTFD